MFPVRLFSCLLLMQAIGSPWLARRFWKRRHQPGAAWFGACVLLCGAWALAAALPVLIDHPTVQEGTRSLSWPLQLVVTLCFLRFASAHVQRVSWWRTVRVPALAAVALDLLLMATNPVHSLMWQQSEWIELGTHRVPALVPGAAFYALHLPVTYGLALGGAVLLFSHAFGLPTFHGRRIAVLGIGLLVPPAADLFLHARLGREVDLDPLAVFVTLSCVAWATFHSRHLEVMPAVRSLLFQQHLDGVVVLDAESRIIDTNPAATRLVGHEVTVGAAAATQLPFWDRVRDALEPGDGRSVEVRCDPFVLELRALLIRDDKAAAIGRLLVLRDVTEIARLTSELDAYARTVAHDLKNPLATVVGYLDLTLLREAQLDEASANSLGEAQAGCQRMAGIIDGLLRRRTNALPFLIEESSRPGDVIGTMADEAIRRRSTQPSGDRGA
jgi:PAS domain-containing protein